MPTFTAIALDRLIEPGGAKRVAVSRDPHNSKIDRRQSSPGPAKDGLTYSTSSKVERGASVTPNLKLGRGVSVPPNTVLEKEVFIPSDKLDRSRSASSVEKIHHWTQISPALYATPESTPLPDSPSSFPPSPYIINHKRRGPRLMKSLSEDDVAIHKPDNNENITTTGKEVISISKDDTCVPGAVIDLSCPGDANEKYINGSRNDDHGSADVKNDLKGQNGILHMQQGPEGRNGVLKSLKFNIQPNRIDEYVGPQESMSAKSIGGSEGTGWEERILNSTTPLTEFYDAWDELSSGSGSHHATQDIETELGEIRLSLSMEIEKKKLVEESLHNMRTQWQRISEKLSTVGFTLPADGEQPCDLAAADLCQQVYLARFVANSMGRGTAKAEVEMEMEAQIKLKNFEIARLCDRLHYYEAVNQEMSQRNQEVVETARRLRQRRNRRQKWVWSSIAVAVSIGSAVLAYSYLSSGKGSSPQGDSGVDHKTN